MNCHEKTDLKGAFSQKLTSKTKDLRPLCISKTKRPKIPSESQKLRPKTTLLKSQKKKKILRFPSRSQKLTPKISFKSKKL